MDIERLRRESEKFIRAMEKEYYSNWAGLKDRMNTSAIFRRHKTIFERKALTNLKKAKTGASREERRRLRYLEAALIAGHMEHRVMGLTDKKNTLESKLTVRAWGKELPFRIAAVKGINEDDRELRNEIFDARNEAIEKNLNGILEERMTKLHGLAKTLGFRNYAHLYSHIKKIDLEGLMKKLDTIIKATNKVYMAKLGELTDSMGISLGEAEKHDIAYLFRAKKFDKYFRKDKALPTLKRTLKGIGIHLDAQRNIIVDADQRPKKSPRAFCAPLKVPEKVMLVIMPTGGCNDYNALLHEAGHAEHYSHVRKNEDMEYKYLGDNSVTETYAFLFQYLNADENWVKANTKMGSGMISDYLDFVYTEKLFFLRRYAAKLKYELNG
jgi:oligoendopeptidase F